MFQINSLLVDRCFTIGIFSALRQSSGRFMISGFQWNSFVMLIRLHAGEAVNVKLKKEPDFC